MTVLKEPLVVQERETSEQEVSALVRQAQAGSAEAFAKLFELLRDKLERQALFLARHEANALDLLQETMLEAWKHLDRYDGRARFFSWVCGIMAHRHYSWLRWWRVRASFLGGGPPEESLAEEGPSPGEVASQRERDRVVRQCLDRLPARQRMVVYLRFYAGESLEGIAALTNCSVGTVKSRLFHGLKRLAAMEKIKEFGKER